MTDFAKELLTVNLEDEMRQSYLAYAMSVIVGRALPDVRDGLKPVHRRILYSMSENNNVWNRPYVKCARVVGDVLGKYHPHGDVATYDALVRMAQDFSMRYPLVDGQGNFGSVDGDSPAAYRYTECRMTKLSSEVLSDIDKETVDFVPNYDEKEEEPSVLPTRVPGLLINGSSGIAVGMATNIPPHNIGEIIGAVLALIDTPDLLIDDLIALVPGPDFPTYGIINGAQGIREAYRTGKGRIYIRARTTFEMNESNGKEKIIVHELPYQVNKARLMEKIAELVKDKKIEGITELRDESDKDGMRMVIELRRGEIGEVILNNLYKQTQMQNVFGINMVALVDGQPKLLNLKQILESFIGHRREVVTRRTIYELRKARERAHLLEGLAVALANIDEVIALIKSSANPAEARLGLVSRKWDAGIVSDLLERSGSDASRPEWADATMGLQGKEYQLSDKQAQAILDLKLHRLTGLEKDKIVNEYKELVAEIDGHLAILASPDELMDVIRGELRTIRENFDDERRTVIKETHLNLSLEDLISEEDVVVTLSHNGYTKMQPLTEYRAQRRGGRGKTATKMKDEDFIEKLFVANTHDTILCFSSEGKVYWLKVYELPQASRTSRGKPIVNLLPMVDGETIQAILPVREYNEDEFVLMATLNGTVKKTSLVDFSRPRNGGIIALDLREGNQLIDVAITNGEKDIMLFCSNGKAIRFNEADVRPMGRTAAGVRGMRVNDSDQLISMAVLEKNEENKVLVACENGYGKRTSAEEFSAQRRGGLGVIAIQTSERNGDLVGAALVGEEDEVMLITNGGILVRTPVSEISIVGRNTQGVTLIRLGDKEKLVEIEQVLSLDDDDEDASEAEDDSGTDSENNQVEPDTESGTDAE